MIRRPALLRVLAIGGCLLATVGRAQVAPELDIQALKRMSVEELLQQKVMSVSRSAESWAAAPGNIFLMRDVARATGATRLPEVLRLAPNLFVAQATSSSWAVNARGFGRANGTANKMLVMIDGRTVYSPLFSNVFWENQQVFLPDLERLEVISGPAGSTWGSNAVNGVINIVSKSAFETQGALLFGGGGTMERTNYGVRYGGRVGRAAAFRVYAQGSDYNATRDAQGLEDDRDPWSFSQTGFRLDVGDLQQAELVVQGDVYWGRYENGPVPDTVAEGYNLLSRWTRWFGGDAKLTLQAYYDYVFRDLNGDYRARTHTADVELQHQMQIGPGSELVWGAGYRSISDKVKDTVGLAILPADLRFGLTSIFGQFKHTFADDKLQATAGLRAEENHFSGWELQPNLRLAWRPNATHTAWAAISRATRTPSRLETGFFAPAEPPYFIVGNPDFQSETLDAAELGWRGNVHPGVSVSTTFFWHEYGHLRSVSYGPPITQANDVEGRSYGTEVFVDWDVTPIWRVRFGGFRIEQESWVRPGAIDLEQGLGESSFPKYQLQLRNSFRLGKNVNLWLGLRHVAEVPAFADNLAPVPAYTELDARLAWRPRPDVELSLVGRNLLDKSHPEIGGAQTRREIPRSLQATVRCEF